MQRTRSRMGCVDNAPLSALCQHQKPNGKNAGIGDRYGSKMKAPGPALHYECSETDGSDWQRALRTYLSVLYLILYYTTIYYTILYYTILYYTIL